MGTLVELSIPSKEQPKDSRVDSGSGDILLNSLQCKLTHHMVVQMAAAQAIHMQRRSRDP